MLFPSVPVLSSLRQLQLAVVHVPADVARLKKAIAARIMIAPTVEPTAIPAIAAVVMSVSAAGGVGLGVWVRTGLEGDVEDGLDGLDVLDALDAMHD